MKGGKQMTVQDLYNILMTHAKDKNVKHCNIVMLDSNNFGPTMFFNDAIHDREGKKSMQKLAERINEFYSINV